MNKNQQKNRMGAVIILLAAACLNGYVMHNKILPKWPLIRKRKAIAMSC